MPRCPPALPRQGGCLPSPHLPLFTSHLLQSAQVFSSFPVSDLPASPLPPFPLFVIFFLLLLVVSPSPLCASPAPRCHSPTVLPPQSPAYFFMSWILCLVLADSPPLSLFLVLSSIVPAPPPPCPSSNPSLPIPCPLPSPCPLPCSLPGQTCCWSPTTPTTTPSCLRERCLWPPSMTPRSSWPRM